MARRSSGLRLTLVLGALASLGPLSIDLYLPTFPTVARALGTSVAAVQLTLATYLFGLAVGQLFYGPLADRFGRRRPLLAGLALYLAATIACAAAPSLGVLAGARFVQALGGCAGMVISRAVVRDRFELTDASRVYSSLLLVMGVAPVLAPLVGAQVLAASGWRGVFGVLLGAGAALLALVAVALPESLPPGARHRHGLRQTLQSFRAALAHRPFVRLSLAGGAVQAAMFAYIAGSPFVFIERYGVPPGRFGFIFGANAIGLVSTSQANRWLARRFGVVPVLRAGTVVAVVGYGALLAALLAGARLPVVLPALFVGVCSYGLVAPNATAAAMDHFPQKAGSASSILGVLQATLGALASTAVSVLADGTTRPFGAVTFGCGLLAAALVATFGRRPSVTPRG